MIYDLFSEFFDDGFFSFAPAHSQTVADIICPECKTRLSQVLKSGRFGCGECYEAFGKYTKQILNNIHSTSVHKGKVSAAASEQIKIKREIEKLEKSLKEAIEKQEFESAAQIRDEIKKLVKEAE